MQGVCFATQEKIIYYILIINALKIYFLTVCLCFIHYLKRFVNKNSLRLKSYIYAYFISHKHTPSQTYTYIYASLKFHYYQDIYVSAMCKDALSKIIQELTKGIRMIHLLFS